MYITYTYEATLDGNAVCCDGGLLYWFISMDLKWMLIANI